MNPAARNLLNFVAFQLAWFACVLGGAHDRVAAGTLAVAAVVALHLALAPRPGPEARLVAVVTAIGLVWDSLVVSLGLMSYPAGVFAPGLAPLWILAMWALFATTLNLSMGWLKGRPWLAAAFGAVGGPLAYLAGKKFGGVEMGEPALALLAQGLGWAVMMPLLLRLAARLNGFEATRLASPRLALADPRHV
jgi:Protein of unknown function (DUF2878)